MEIEIYYHLIANQNYARNHTQSIFSHCDLLDGILEFNT